MNRQFSWLLLLAAIAFQPVTALPKEPPPTGISQETAPNESDLKEHGHYVNKKGKSVHAPAHSKSGAVPQGATAQCRDGSYSFSQSHRGTCSRHGGVASWL